MIGREKIGREKIGREKIGREKIGREKIAPWWAEPPAIGGGAQMRFGRRMYGGLALLSCLGFGAALGVWLFALAGDHLVVVPRAAVLASLLVGMLCLWVGAFSLFMLAQGATLTRDRSSSGARVKKSSMNR